MGFEIVLEQHSLHELLDATCDVLPVALGVEALEVGHDGDKKIVDGVVEGVCLFGNADMGGLVEISGSSGSGVQSELRRAKDRSCSLA